MCIRDSLNPQIGVLCPVCRGPVQNVRRFKYISEGQFTVSEHASDTSDHESPQTRRTSNKAGQSTTAPLPINVASSSNSTTSWMHVNPSIQRDMFSWWPVENSYHSTTRLEDGRHGLLVDPGAWSNLVGEQWVVDMAKKALKSGWKPDQRRMDRPLTVQGVGAGANKAEWEVRMPIAITESVNGELTTKVFDYKAPTVSGAGKNLPALLGLQSMSKQCGVLEMQAGEEYLTFPGQGGYSIEWSPGTRRYKLERAPSGHLILPCDAFQDIKSTTGGLATSTKEFFTDRPQETASSSTDMPVDNPVHDDNHAHLTMPNVETPTLRKES